MSNSLTILHLSDLHFGNKNRFAEVDTAKMAAEFHQSVVAEMSVLNVKNPLDLVIVTGDFAETGHRFEFQAAHAFLDALAEAAKLPRTRFVLLPGNHDINWGDCKNLRNDLENGDVTPAEFPALLAIKKLDRYHAFVRDFYDLPKPHPGASGTGANLASLGCCHPLGHGGWLWDYPDLPLSVAALNSSEREDDQSQGGYLSEDQTQALMSHWRASDKPRLRVIATHHNPVATTQDNVKWTNDWIAEKERTTGTSALAFCHYINDLVGFEGRELLKAVAKDTNAHLVLHGHHHDAKDSNSWPCVGDGHCAVLSAGSFGLKDEQLPGDAPLSCQIICFVTDTDRPRLIAHPLVYDPRLRPRGAVKVGSYRAEPRSDAAYDKPLVLPDGWAPPVMSGSSPVAGPSPALRQLHHEQQRKAHGAANLGGLYAPGEKDRSDAIRLEDIFVEPSFVSYKDEAATRGEGALAHERRREAESELSELRLPAVSALGGSDHRLMVLGEPGSGKSSLLHWYLLKHLAVWEAVPSAPLPLYLRLSLWELDCGCTQGLVSYAQKILEKDLNQPEGSLSAWFTKEAPVVWLLDGVDEVRDPKRRSQLLDELTKLPNTLPGHRWVITSRPTGYQRGALGNEWREVALAPLDSSQAKDLLANWSRLLEVLDLKAVFDAELLYSALGDQVGLSRLRRNPLLLTMIVLFYRDSKRLPDHRWEFYEHAARALRRSWVKFRSDRFGSGDDVVAEVIDADWLDPVLSYLAIEAMRKSEVVFTRDALRSVVATALTLRNYSPTEVELRVAAFTNRALKFIGVFVEKGPDRFGFLHLTFQEYYAASWLTVHEDEAALLISSQWQHPDWREVWDLYVLGLKENDKKLDALHKAVGSNLDAMLIRLRWLGLGAAPFPESGPRDEVRKYAVDALQYDVSPEESSDALGVLARWERSYPPDILKGLQQLLDDPENDRCHLAARALGEQTEGRELRTELLRMLCGNNDQLRGFAELALSMKADSPRVSKDLLALYHGAAPEGWTGGAVSVQVRAAAARALGGRVPAVELWGEPPVEKRVVQLTSEVAMTFLRIPKGTLVGGDNLKHRVELTEDFWMAQTQVTQAQWEAVMGSNPSQFKGAHRPVETVSWLAIASDTESSFNHRLAQHPAYRAVFGEGSAVHLPTEAQWEYACRAGSKTAFHYGDSLGSHQANMNGSLPGGKADKGVVRERTVVVGSFAPNAWGLHDMHGNVWEWCQDWHANYLTKLPANFAGPAAGRFRVLRGGSWIDLGGLARSAYRNAYDPGTVDDRIGFRPCLSSTKPSGRAE